jgi:hypothetical protein
MILVANMTSKMYNDILFQRIAPDRVLSNFIVWITSNSDNKCIREFMKEKENEIEK